MIDLGLAGSILVLGWAAVAGACQVTARTPLLAAALAGGVTAAFVPLDGLPVHGYVRGHLGELSVTSQVLLAAGVSRRLGGPAPFGRRDRRALAWGILGAAVVLYPLSLGLTPFDPYALGYGSSGLVAAAGAAALVCWLLSLGLPFACVVLALLAYGLGLGESPNLWDYLLDPWASLYAAALLLTPARRRTGVGTSQWT